MDPRSPGSFPPGGSQPPFGQPFGQQPHGQQPYGQQPFGPPGGPGQGAPNPPGGSYPPNPNAYQPSGYGNVYGNPYGDPRFGQMPPPPPPSRWWLWLLLGGGGVVALFCCGGVGLFVVAMNYLESEVQKSLANEPAIQEHVGDLESVDFDIMATGELTEQNEGDDRLVFNLKGSKGNAVLIGETTDDGDGNVVVVNGVLRLPSGEEVPISP
jgi:hypothetical protein